MSDNTKVAVTKYQTVQVAHDQWDYCAMETRVFGQEARLADVLEWAKPSLVTDLVFTPLSETP